MLDLVAGRVSSPVVVGRASELATLVDVLDRAQAGATVAVLLGGEAGVGKTRTSAEVERIASDRGSRVLRGGRGAPLVRPTPAVSVIHPSDGRSSRTICQ